MQLSVVDLEQMFLTSENRPEVLVKLRDELRFRQVPKAVALLRKVLEALPATQSTEPEVSAAQAPLFGKAESIPPRVPLVLENPQPEATPRPALKKIALPGNSRPAPVPSSETVPLIQASMDADAACRVLNLVREAPWSAVEQRRRELVQLSHPSLLRKLTPERRAAALEQARLVNTAYLSLAASRKASA